MVPAGRAILHLCVLLAYTRVDAQHGTRSIEDAERAQEAGLRFFIPSRINPKAVCLDGTEPVIYWREPNVKSNKWIVNLEGWGFCDSLENCLSRSGTYPGSTKSDTGIVIDMPRRSVVFNANSIENPLLHDFNWVYVRYCDGGYFMGDVEEPIVVNQNPRQQIYFRGRYIKEAVIDFLKVNLGMDSATDFIISGCSSGGISTITSADSWRSLVPWIPKFRAFADSGYYLDTPIYTPLKKFLYEYHKSSSSLNAKCLAAYKETPWYCHVSSISIAYTETPVFAWESRYDSNQLGGSPCGATEQNWQQDPNCVNTYGERMLSSLRENMVSHHGFFSDGCHRHCWAGWRPLTVSASGVTPLMALKRWYHGEKTNLVQDGMYPCATCCSEPVNVTDRMLLYA